ncbi:MAG: VanZ family protein [Actinomycetota bacterium]|nr:VanZ family protein [Actinomycetota bacterium]
MHVMGYRVPALVLAVAVAAALGVVPVYLRLRGDRGRARAAMAAVATWCYVVTVAVALAPSTSEGAGSSCVFTGAGDLLGWRHDDQRLLNVLLYVPLGALAMLVPATRVHRWIALAAVASTPPILELVQLTPAVGRSCDAADVVDNWLGAALGVGLGAAVLLVARYLGSDPRRPAGRLD